MPTKRYWLRGGITLSSAYILLSALEIIFLNDCFGSFCVNDDWLMYLNPGVFFAAWGIAEGGNMPFSNLIILGLLSATIIGGIFFLIGSALGWAYGKITKR